MMFKRTDFLLLGVVTVEDTPEPWLIKIFQSTMQAQLIKILMSSTHFLLSI